MRPPDAEQAGDKRRWRSRLSPHAGNCAAALARVPVLAAAGRPGKQAIAALGRLSPIRPAQVQPLPWPSKARQNLDAISTVLLTLPEMFPEGSYVYSEEMAASDPAKFLKVLLGPVMWRKLLLLSRDLICGAARSRELCVIAKPLPTLTPRAQEGSRAPPEGPQVLGRHCAEEEEDGSQDQQQRLHCLAPRARLTFLVSQFFHVLRSMEPHTGSYSTLQYCTVLL